MAKFKYSAVTGTGKQVSGVVEGMTIHTVAADLLDQGLDVRHVKERESALQFEITKSKVKPAEVMHFSRQLAAFVRAGVPLPEAIDTIGEETRDKMLKKILHSVSDGLRRGESLSTAVAPYADAFPPFYVSVLRSVELTGRLDHVLDQLSSYLERDLDARRKLKSAVAYPLLVCVMAVVVVVIMAAFVLPRFKTFFKSFHAKLPLPTRMMLAITDFLSAWWPVLLGGLIVFIVAMVVAVRVGWAKRVRDSLLLRLPAVGVVARYAVVERFCRILCSMVQAGVPLPDALALATEGTHNLVFQRELATAREAMLEGEGLARPIAATHLFPPAATQMMRVGEDTGTLDDQLESMSNYYEKELEYKLNTLTTMFEPAVIIFVGLLVGFVALALISAMYGIFNQVKVK